MFLDNDFIKIAEKIDTSAVQLEIHISSKGFSYEKDATPGKNRLPRDSAISFLGNISKSFNAWSTSDDNKHPDLVGPEADPNKAIKQMVKDNSKLIKDQKNDAAVTFETKKIYKAGKAFYSSNKDKTLIMANAFSFVIFRGVSSAKSLEWMSWTPEGAKVPTAVSTSAVSSASGKVIVPDADGTYANTKITDAHKKTFEKFNGKTLLFSSPNSALDGITSIVVPQGSNLTKKFELIYFLHGYGGSNNSQGWNQNLLKKVAAMPKKGTGKTARNVVYVTTQLNVAESAKNDKNATFRSGSGKSFVAFHKDVIHYLGKKGLNATASPAFINFKVYGEGYYSLDGIITQLSSPNIEGVPVQRIDYLDASYKFKDVRNVVYGNSAFKPGTNFEILVFCTNHKDSATYKKVEAYHNTTAGANKYNGDNVITEDGEEVEYSKLQGLYINETGASHSNVYSKYFAEKSLLPDGKGDAAESFEPVEKSGTGGPKINIKNVPVSYDKDGNAINSDGETLPDKYDLPLKDLKCTKDQIKNHKAKTTVPQAQKDCEKACKDVLSGKEPKKPPFDRKNAHKIENPFNPTGLTVHPEPNFKSSDKKRSPGSITTIVLHEGALSRAGTARTLNKKHLGTHFTIGSFGTYQHIDLDRITGHAGEGRNARSIGIDLVFNHTTTISKSFAQFATLRDKPAADGKPSGAEQLRKKKGLTSTQQIIKTKWDGGNMSIIPNQSLLEKTYKLVKALVNKYPSIRKEVPAAAGDNIIFGYGGTGHSGIVAHRFISTERSDGQWAQLYIYLRMKKGLTPTPAYKKLLEISWKAAGWNSANDGDRTTGYPKDIKRKAKRKWPMV
jgi:hypothetical protein